MEDHPPSRRTSASYPRGRKFFRWFSAAYALLLVYVSLAPGQRIPKIFDWGQLFSPDKIAHFGAYAFFAVLLSFSSSIAPRWKKAATAAVIAALFGALMECLQAVSGTGRFFDPVDMVANTLGALLGGLIYLLLQSTVIKYLAPARS